MRFKPNAEQQHINLTYSFGHTGISQSYLWSPDAEIFTSVIPDIECPNVLSGLYGGCFEAKLHLHCFGDAEQWLQWPLDTVYKFILFLLFLFGLLFRLRDIFLFSSGVWLTSIDISILKEFYDVWNSFAHFASIFVYNKTSCGIFFKSRIFSYICEKLFFLKNFYFCKTKRSGTLILVKFWFSILPSGMNEVITNCFIFQLDYKIFFFSSS